MQWKFYNELFVPYYCRKAHTKDALKWLDIFEKRRQISGKHDNPGEAFASTDLQNEESSVPVLVCMTFADRLLAELMDDNGKYDVARAKKQVAKNFEVKYYQVHNVMQLCVVL